MPLDERIEEIIDREGGYVDHPDDRGGPTKWGITEKVARAHGYHGDMKDLPYPTAKAIYRQKYWRGINLHQVADIAGETVAEELFDTAVHAGPNAAGTFLQRVLNVANRQQEDFRDISVDGIIGAETLEALRAYMGARPEQGPKILERALDALGAARLTRLAESDPSQESFWNGWIARELEEDPS
jgi:lysozyme family protein